MAAAGYPNYSIQDNVAYATTKEATDHRQILLLETEWREIKRCTKNIKFEDTLFDWFNIFLGATFSTVIPLFYSLYNYISSEEKDLSDIVFYLVSTVVLLIISLLIKLKKETNKYNICNSIHHENLMSKIEEIDNRVNNELSDI